MLRLNSSYFRSLFTWFPECKGSSMLYLATSILCPWSVSPNQSNYPQKAISWLETYPRSCRTLVKGLWIHLHHRHKTSLWLSACWTNLAVSKNRGICLLRGCGTSPPLPRTSLQWIFFYRASLLMLQILSTINKLPELNDSHLSWSYPKSV